MSEIREFKEYKGSELVLYAGVVHGIWGDSAHGMLIPSRLGETKHWPFRKVAATSVSALGRWIRHNVNHDGRDLIPDGRSRAVLEDIALLCATKLP